MKSIILCSPSPGTEASEMMTCICTDLSRENAVSEMSTHPVPAGIGVDFKGYPVAQRSSQKIHEGRSWRNRVGVPGWDSFVEVFHLLPHCYGNC